MKGDTRTLRRHRDEETISHEKKAQSPSIKDEAHQIGSEGKSRKWTAPGSRKLNVGVETKRKHCPAAKRPIFKVIRLKGCDRAKRKERGKSRFGGMDTASEPRKKRGGTFANTLKTGGESLPREDRTTASYREGISATANRREYIGMRLVGLP